MSRVYSTIFVATRSQNVNASYVIPEGQLMIVRDITAFFEGNPGDTAMQIFGSDFGTLYYHLQIDPNEYVHEEMWQVLNQGNTLTVLTAGPNTVSLRVSGYLLDLP